MTNSPKDTPRTTASPAPPSSANQPFKGDPEKRKYDKDGVELGNRTSSTIRNNCIGVIYNGLAFRSRESIESVLEKAMAVEKAAFETYKGETDEYKKKIRSLFQNLKNKTNQDLGRKIMSGEVTPARFVVMTHEELKSAEQKTIDEKLEKENMNKAQVAMPEKSISDALTCGKCQKKKVSYTQAQTRSADEPMTTFCECLECGNRWKVSKDIMADSPFDSCSNLVSIVLLISATISE